MKKIFKRVRLFLKEILNLITNVLVPIVSVVISILEVLPVPSTWIKVMKIVEYWLFYAFGTAKNIDEAIEENEKKLK